MIHSWINNNKRLLAPLPCNAVEILVHGGVALDCEGPAELLHGGEHDDDTSRELRQSYQRASNRGIDHCPRAKLVELLEKKGFKRPTPKAWLKPSCVVVT
jgi:hypothetical protein